MEAGKLLNVLWNQFNVVLGFFLCTAQQTQHKVRENKQLEPHSTEDGGGAQLWKEDKEMRVSLKGWVFKSSLGRGGGQSQDMSDSLQSQVSHT